MRNYKFSFFGFTVLFLGLSSCSKIAERNVAAVQTTTRDIIISNNTIPLSAAITTGLNFLQQENAGITISLKNAETVVKNGKPYFHIINANKGFVILSPGSAYIPVLAYDSDNNFSFADKDINPGLKQWFNKHAIEIDFIRNTHNSYTDSIGKVNKMLWKSYSVAVKKEKEVLSINTVKKPNNPTPLTAPMKLISSVPYAYSTVSTVGLLCATHWEQDNPFNEYCPSEPNSGTPYAGHAPVGCVPVAMGQIIYYWNTPLAHLAKYNFSIMPLDLTSWTWDGMNQAAQLLSDIGSITGPMLMQISLIPFNLTLNGTFASYGTNSIGCDDTYAPWVFGAFGMSSASRSESITNQELTGANNGTYFTGLLTNEVQAGRPCMVSAFPSETNVVLAIFPSGTGHSWVCDGSTVGNYFTGVVNTYQTVFGVDDTTTYTDSVYSGVYQTNWLHMNWGWGLGNKQGGISNDGWYNCLGSYSTAYDGTDYQYFQTIIYNIHP